MSEPLIMKFDPMTIEHLGVRMYSTLPPVVAELLANSADADATHATIHLNDNQDHKEIIVEDDGEGMSYDDLNEKFLLIGRNRREDEKGSITAKGRKVIGKKGLGKLSFFGIAMEIEVVTRKAGFENAFLMSWGKIKEASEKKIPYKPEPIRTQVACDPAFHGTTITLRGISRKGDFDADGLAVSISKIFIVDPSFSISIQYNGGAPVQVDNSLKYQSLDKEIEWEVPYDVNEALEYLSAKKIKGHLIATRKPISPKTNMRGITLFSRKKLVNNPEYFSESTSSHFYSYLTGWLEVDFIDDLPEDVIATNRQSLDWGYPEMFELRENLRKLLNWMERDWRKKRGENREKILSEKTGINISGWFATFPPEIRDLMMPVVQALVNDSELPEETINSATLKLREIVPDYPRFHWRNLHPKVQSVSESYYISGDYYTAFIEAVKLYVEAVKTKAGSSLTDHALLENVWSLTTPKLSVTNKFKKPDGSNFDATTLDNITQGHRMLVLGVWMACRNPLAHELVVNLRDSGLFTEKDCLDALGLVSHLFNRLDNSQ